LGLLRLSCPSEDAVDGELTRHEADALSYSIAGATRGPLPEGWRHDDQHRELGSGADTWARAQQALDRWTQFDLPWVRFHGQPPIVEGQTVAFASRQLGVWTLNMCRIVYVVNEDGPDSARYGFAYGTLANHAVAGEELFELHWDKNTDVVTFRIAKFSRPAHPLVWLAGPLATCIQEQFTVDALARMVEEVGA
jgi:uncharacterized protein (UPF0548 family)